MRNFIAKMGYTLMWAFGIPEYSLEEKFEEYYRVGLLIAIIGITAIILLPLVLIWYLREDKSEENA